MTTNPRRSQIPIHHIAYDDWHRKNTCNSFWAGRNPFEYVNPNKNTKRRAKLPHFISQVSVAIAKQSPLFSDQLCTHTHTRTKKPNCSVFVFQMETVCSPAWAVSAGAWLGSLYKFPPKPSDVLENAHVSKWTDYMYLFLFLLIPFWSECVCECRNM